MWLFLYSLLFLFRLNFEDASISIFRNIFNDVHYISNKRQKKLSTLSYFLFYALNFFFASICCWSLKIQLLSSLCHQFLFFFHIFCFRSKFLINFSFFASLSISSTHNVFQRTLLRILVAVNTKRIIFVSFE